MNNPLRIILYVVLAVVAAISGSYALANFGQMMERAGARHSELEQVEPERPAAAEETAAAEAASNKVSAVSNLSAVITESTTNAAAGATNLPPSVAPLQESTEAMATGAVRAAAAPKSAGGNAGESASAPAAMTRGGGRIGLWTAVFVLSLVGLGLLLANDLSHYFGNRALRTLYNDDLEGIKDPEYEQAEEVWANGQHLEAVGLMREYLKKNPREQHVAIRIAEIYEKDLKNYLAAALEYEEVLKHKLQPERWGWSAIHLCNLYFKLNQEEKAYSLLRRLVREHANTAAADKARKRLEQVGETAESEQIATESQVPGGRPSTAEGGTNLPPGFRPKK